MSNLPPLTEKINKGAEGGHEFERLLNQLLLCFADRHNFEYETRRRCWRRQRHRRTGSSGRSAGLRGRSAFQFKWLWDNIHKGSKAGRSTDSLERRERQ